MRPFKQNQLFIPLFNSRLILAALSIYGGKGLIRQLVQIPIHTKRSSTVFRYGTSAINMIRHHPALGWIANTLCTRQRQTTSLTPSPTSKA